MLLPFFTALRDAKVPVSLKEWLHLMDAMDRGVASGRVDDFYHLSRAVLVKDEKHYDRFDQVFARVFSGVESVGPDALAPAEIPGDWLKLLTEKYLSDEEKAQIQALGGLDALMDTLRKRLEEQQGRHEGGNKWIGTGGTSPFGHGGYNPEGVRIGGPGRQGRAVKVWEKREYRNLDDSVELGTRNIKVALRRLRRFARQGAPDELDMDATIDGTARQGWLDIHMRPERRNTIKVLLFLDVGGSMDAHVQLCEELFSAARTEFKHLEFFYFHNCLYEGVWKDNRRRHAEKTPTWEVLNKYPGDWRAIFVGDATMSPYEVTMPGGSVEHWNEEAGAVWLKRATQQWDRIAWLNPAPERYWGYSASVGMIRELVEDRMYPLTLEGLDKAMRALSR
ncbi:MAG: VWA domain-containing protein [Alphaproteobacteria bacterium]|nr:VWA domain-containing protein [Alphaproteobacteria bacterium]MBU1525585.1 VWA domain-containing protein [Alphaproteobacteria bacterium]MBU2350251.1 VWA domain-containing protein [Alphaproteobacteria bacterium]MBU2381379.1 VWA domain-containing protein [Alphaproteobacteria bacterium]